MAREHATHPIHSARDIPSRRKCVKFISLRQKSWHFMALYLRALRGAGVATPWGCIYIIDKWMHDRRLRRHELVHIAQMRREGAWKMAAKWYYYTFKYGYRDNPYEVEARRIGGV